MKWKPACGAPTVFIAGSGANGFRCKRAEEALVVQNSRLQLLLKLTKEITSNLELRQLLRAISANIREVMDCDAVHISLADPESDKFRLYALDFPEGKGFVKEEMLIESVGASRRALET